MYLVALLKMYIVTVSLGARDDPPSLWSNQDQINAQQIIVRITIKTDKLINSRFRFHWISLICPQSRIMSAPIEPTTSPTTPAWIRRYQTLFLKAIGNINLSGLAFVKHHYLRRQHHPYSNRIGSSIGGQVMRGFVSTLAIWV